jgi:ADP-ribose pyrophosphatase
VKAPQSILPRRHERGSLANTLIADAPSLAVASACDGLVVGVLAIVSGGALEYFVLELADWVNVVPVTSARELVMVRQYRHATRGVTLEIPAGSVKENEVPADAARRELLEETGYAAGNLIHLGTWECNPALQTNRLHSFLGLDVEMVAEPAAELDEGLEVMTVPQAHWLSDRIDSAFSHYFSSYAIELARAHVRAPEGSVTLSTL